MTHFVKWRWLSNLLGSALLAAAIATTAAAQTSAPPPQANSTPPAKPPACEDPLPAPLPAGNVKLTVTIDPASAWRPRGGEVRFTIKGADTSADGMMIVTCFRWATDDARDNPWVQSPAVRMVDNSTAGAPTFAASVPRNLPPAPGGWWDRIRGRTARGAGVLGIVPLADFRVMARSAEPANWSPLDVVQPVGVTSKGWAFLVALSAAVFAWALLFTWGNIAKCLGPEIYC